jgi:hypothetical protein
VHAQQSVGQTVKSAHPHRAGADVQQRFGSGTQFCCGFVGKGDGQDAVGRNAFHVNQPSNTVNQHTGFSASGTGYDQGISQRRRNRVALGLVKPVKNVGYIQE